MLIVVPGSRPDLAVSSGLAGVLLRSLVRRGTDACVALRAHTEVSVAAFDATTHTVLEPPAAWHGGENCHWRGYPLADFARRLQRAGRLAQLHLPQVVVFASATYTLRGQPGLHTLLANAAQRGMAGVGSASDGVYAFAMFAIDVVRESPYLAQLLTALCVRTPAGAGLPPLSGESNLWEPPLTQGPDMSPTLRGLQSRPAFAPADSPAYLNTAISEALENPAAHEVLGDDPQRLRRALMAQREASGVRWIFNELLNVVEYRCAHPEPASVPPEIHIAIAGRCNIECRFCSYNHKDAVREPVSLSQVMRFEILRDIRTLRLHSGNGEPTLNRELPALIDYVTCAHPQVAMNFFTNGILLDKPQLIDALVGGHVGWISVSLNAATPQQWQRLCGVDQFARVLHGLEQMQAAKRARGSVTPVVHGSMVLTKDSVWELPQMPALCRRLGVDRFTAIPFFSLGYDRPERLGPEDAYHHIGTAYDALYHETMQEAQRWDVSIELPPPQQEKKAAFGVETRIFRDFAQVERNCDAVEHLLSSWTWPQQPPCHFLWKQAAVGIATKGQSTHPGGNYLYPCLGPLATVNFAPHTPVVFGEHDSFMRTWRNPIFTRLREGQSRRGAEPVCDACRGCDTRAPQQIASIQLLLSRFVREHGLA
jgi:MoaA/NifB/PqqE/SkfB family radical SAM enzyme